MYGIAGERRLPELELSWLSGYEGSRPVRIGNEAVSQFQLDVYGELMDCIHHARLAGIPISDETWRLQQGTLAFLEAHWRDPDNGIWEVRGPRRHFTHSKVMAWVAFDRGIRGVEQFGLSGPVDRWRKIRDEIHAEVCSEGYDATRNTFTQYYGSQSLDASLLFIPLVGFLPPDDARVLGTIEAISKVLCRDGLISRYRPDPEVEGLPGREGVFIACSFWMADCLSLIGRRDEARALFERVITFCNDVGLLSEECDPETERLLGNFPQALSHVALVIAAESLDAPGGLADARSRR